MMRDAYLCPWCGELTPGHGRWVVCSGCDRWPWATDDADPAPVLAREAEAEAPEPPWWPSRFGKPELEADYQAAKRAGPREHVAAWWDSVGRYVPAFHDPAPQWEGWDPEVVARRAAAERERRQAQEAREANRERYRQQRTALRIAAERAIREPRPRIERPAQPDPRRPGGWSTSRHWSAPQ